MTENEIQKLCEAYLKDNDILFLPRYNENIRKRNIGIRKDLKGWADLTIFLREGKTIFVELKKVDGVISADQIKFMSRVDHLDYEYHVIYSYESFIALMKKYL